MIARASPRKKPSIARKMPQRLWVYFDVYHVMRVRLAPHPSRVSTEYVRADYWRTQKKEAT